MMCSRSASSCSGVVFSGGTTIYFFYRKGEILESGTNVKSLDQTCRKGGGSESICSGENIIPDG